MVTMSDIATKAGVSTATVSRVLNNRGTSIPISKTTKKVVQEIAEEMGYTPNMYAKTLRTKKSMLIGVGVWDLTDSYFSDILRGVENTLHKSGYNLLLTSAEGKSSRECANLKKMRDLHVDGILLVGGSKGACKQDLSWLDLDPASLVLIGTTAENPNINSVTVDNYKGGYIGIQFLLTTKRKKYFYFAGKQKTSDMDERLKGVKQAIADYASPSYAPQSCTKPILEIFDIGPGEQDGYDITQQILSTDALPAGIFAVNDLTALGVLRAVRDLNLRVPEDVAILGFDDLSITTFFHPRLSTIHQPRYEIGEMGAKILLEGIKAKNGSESLSASFEESPKDWNAKHIQLDPELVVRESS